MKVRVGKVVEGAVQRSEECSEQGGGACECGAAMAAVACRPRRPPGPAVSSVDGGQWGVGLASVAPSPPSSCDPMTLSRLAPLSGTMGWAGASPVQRPYPPSIHRSIGHPPALHQPSSTICSSSPPSQHPPPHLTHRISHYHHLSLLTSTPSPASNPGPTALHCVPKPPLPRTPSSRLSSPFH